MNQIERRKIVCKLIRDVYSSLDTHLDPTHEDLKRCAGCGSKAFHAECVRDYARMLLDLSKLL